MKTTSKKGKPQFKTAYIELEKLAQEFDEGSMDLEESIPKFKRALELSRTLKERLKEMENEIKLVQKEYGDLDD